MANKVRTVFANMGWMLISQFITSVLAFVWTILMARYLGPSEYGIFGTAVSLTAILSVIGDAGIGAFIVRSISTDLNNESTFLNNAFSLELFLDLLYLIVIVLTAFLIGWNNYIIIICFLYGVENVIRLISTIFSTLFQIHEQMKYQAISNIILNVSTFIFIILVTFTNFGLYGITFAYIFSNLLSLIYVVISIRNHFIKPKFSFNLSFYKMLLKGGFPFALGGIFYTIYFSIDIVMVTQFSSTFETGLYNAAYKLISVITLFYSIYSAVVFPVMSKLFEDSKDLLQHSLVKSMKYLLLASIPIAVFTCFYSYDIINIYGAEYIQAGGVLKILIWCVSLLFVNGATTLALNASHEEYSVIKMYFIAALFNIVLNLFLIPKYSVYGASFATVLSEIVIFMISLYVLNRINQLPNRHFVFDVLKIISASGILAIALYFLNLNMWLAMPVSLIVYFAAILLLKTPDDEDKLILKQILNK